MATSGKRILKSFTLETKYRALMDLKSGMKNVEVSTKYGAPKNTVSTWKKTSEKIISAYESCVVPPKRKRLRTGQHTDLDLAVLEWFKSARSKNIPIGGRILQEKAMQYAKELDIGDFHASDGWLEGWKQRFSVSFKIVSGESAAVTGEMVAPWNETALPTLLSKYELKDIYNADECGLFFQALPNKTFDVSKKSCHGGKESKVRITVLCCANAIGEKFPLFVIGKSKQPRCFKGVKNLPCRYRNQTKAWMNGELFSEWVREFDRVMTAQGRNVVLILDNCKAHPQNIAELKSVKLSFLPPNTTSVTQPMDQGVIRTMKAYYRIHLVRRLIREIDDGTPTAGTKGVSILDAMMMLKSAWQQVKDSTVQGCFRKAGISRGSQEDVLTEADNPFATEELPKTSSTTTQLQEELSLLQSKDSSLVPQSVTADDWVSCDDEVATSGFLRDDEIIEHILHKDDACIIDSDPDDSESEADDTPLPVSASDVREALNVIHRFSLFTEDRSIGSDLVKLEASVEAELVQKVVQTKVTDFFAPQTTPDATQ